MIRACTQELTGEVTFPQVFVDGKFIGGAADACIKWKKGELQPILEAAGVKPPVGETEEIEKDAPGSDTNDFGRG